MLVAAKNNRARLTKEKAFGTEERTASAVFYSRDAMKKFYDREARKGVYKVRKDGSYFMVYVKK